MAQDMSVVESMEAETKQAFPIGCRVRLSEHGKRFARRKDKEGTVVWYSAGGYAFHGFNSICCLRVLWDGNKTPSSSYRSDFERIP